MRPISQTEPGFFSKIDDPTRVSAAVEFRHVFLAYGDDVVLDDISFQLKRGELLIILSSSGGGKSTILRLAIGLAKPDKGQILIDGEDVTKYDEEMLNRVRQKIGMDFQDGALFDSLSVYDNIAFRCHENNVPEDQVEQQVRRLLRFVDLEDSIDKMPAELSGGMRIRVGIARAMIGSPQIILFDEPTAGLDPPTAWDICELGIRLRDLRDVSCMFVTHELESLRTLISNYAYVDPDDRIVIEGTDDRLCLANTKVMMLRDGRIYFYGSYEQLHNSQDSYIREFLLM